MLWQCIKDQTPLGIKMSLIERAAIIIKTIEYVTIATVCPDGTPWNSPVYTAYDNDLNFYWKSWVENQHSKNISACPDVFLVLYDSRAKAMEGEGVYIKAKAKPLMIEDAEDIKKGFDSIVLRAGHCTTEYTDFFDGDPRRVYKASPTHIWMNDGSTLKGDFIDIRNKIDMKELKKELEKIS